MDIGYKMACKVYGIRPLSKDEEFGLSIEERIIRQSKIDIVNICNELRKAIDEIDSIAVEIDEKKVIEKNRIINLKSKVSKMLAISKGEI